MRDLKFRVWDEQTQKMWFTDEVPLKFSLCFAPLGVYSKVVGSGSYQPAVNHIMQYTGLKDKNGKEIYEGDIVNAGVWGSVSYYDETKFIIKFSEGAFRGFRFEYFKKKDRFRFSTPVYKLEMVEVIGNIYENPKLLAYSQKA